MNISHTTAQTRIDYTWVTTHVLDTSNDYIKMSNFGGFANFIEYTRLRVFWRAYDL